MTFPTIQPGTWYEVPNSKIASVLPSPLPPGSGGPSTIITGWSGGAYDSLRDEMMLTGGGHGDYAGNEQYRFSFNSMAWTRAWGPTPNNQIPEVTQAGKPTYLNGDPASRHTYSGVQYMSKIDRMFICGGSLWGGSGGMGPDVWLWTSATFERMKDITWSSPQVPYAAYDPQTGHIFQHRYNRFAEWDHDTDVWTRIGQWGAGGSPKATTCIDPKRRKFYLIGGNGVWSYNLAGTEATNQVKTVPTTGPQNIVQGNYPGVEYDPTWDCIVGWSGGDVIYKLDLTTFAWSAVQPSSKLETAEQHSTTPPTQGTHGRWRYISAHDCYFIVNSINENVYLYRPDRGTSGVTIQVAASVTARVI